MILVTGATGNNGVELIKLLAAQGQAVRALVRNPQKAEAIKLPEVELVQGDLSDPASLQAALSGVDKVFLLSSNDERVVDLQQNMIEAAQKAGVRHLVRFSVLGVSADSKISFLRHQWQIDQNLIASGLSYTILRPNAFYQNALAFFAATIASDNAFYIPGGDGRISQVDVRDIAAVAANVLSQPEAHTGQIYEITGPEALSYHDIAEKFSQLLGRTISYVNVPSEAYLQTLLSFGTPEWFARDIVALDEWYSQNGAAQVTDVVEKVGKKSPATYDQFLQDYRQAFK